MWMILTRLWPMLLMLTTVAAITSLLIYSVLRVIQKHSRIASWTVNIVICVSVAILIVPSGLLSAPTYAFTVFIASLGAIAHKNSSGDSSGFLPSFILMLSVALALLFAIAVPMNLAFTHFPSATDKFSLKLAVNLLIILQTSTPPFLFWVWKSSRLRPGVDKHFDS